MVGWPDGKQAGRRTAEQTGGMGGQWSGWAGRADSGVDGQDERTVGWAAGQTGEWLDGGDGWARGLTWQEEKEREERKLCSWVY